MSDLLANGLRYTGNYGFTQDGPPTLAGSGVAVVSVSFTGAAPLAAEFIRACKAKAFPRIRDDGTLGNFASGTALTNAFDGVESDGGKVWTRVTLSFAIPATSTPTRIEEGTTDFGASRQSATVIFTNDITLEVQFMAPTATIRWVATAKPTTPKTATPGAALTKEDIRRAYWRDSETGKTLIDQNPTYVPPQEIRLLGWDAKEVLPGLRWECWAQWARVFLSYYAETPAG